MQLVWKQSTVCAHQLYKSFENIPSTYILFDANFYTPKVNEGIKYLFDKGPAEM